jgi:hypothetical protein
MMAYNLKDHNLTFVELSGQIIARAHVESYFILNARIKDRKEGYNGGESI